MNSLSKSRRSRNQIIDPGNS